MSDMNEIQATPALESMNYTFRRSWFIGFISLLGLVVSLPFLAPLFMKLGLTVPAKAIYFVYSFLCHQLPQRSFFLFGQESMYSLSEIQAVWQDTLNPLVLRQFIGNVEMGWKVAWSDRMVSMYTSLLLSALFWWPLRHKIRTVSFWWLFPFLLPMAVDGFSHMLSDLWGLGQGFRYTNNWLVELTGNAFSVSFYIGNGIGSFNSWMRLITGALFGIGMVRVVFPYFNRVAS